MRDGERGEQVRQGSQMRTVLRACVIWMSPVRPQNVFANVSTDKVKFLMTDPGCPLSLQLVILPGLLLHIVHSFLSSQSVRIDVQEVTPNNLA